MKSFASPRFWAAYHDLPQEVRELADRVYKLWQENPRHPSLHFKRLQGSSDRVTVRVGDHYRALGRLDGDTVTLVSIGTHAEHDRLVG